MILDAWMSVLHWWLVFGLIAALVLEVGYCRGAMDAATIRRLARIDMLYGIFALLLVIVGFGRAMHGAKGWAFYSGNPVFWTKIALFALLGLLSIGPTVKFLRWKKATRNGGSIDAAQAASVRKWLHAELALLIPIPVAAAFMARGIGY
jgi:putative membrane protein